LLVWVSVGVTALLGRGCSASPRRSLNNGRVVHPDLIGFDR
jgi:hypothetical protein